MDAHSLSICFKFRGSWYSSYPFFVPITYIDIRTGMLYRVYLKGRRVIMQAYCVKCRTKREIKNPKAITMKNGRPATQGVCPVCGTKMFRIGKSK